MCLTSKPVRFLVQRTVLFGGSAVEKEPPRYVANDPVLSKRTTTGPFSYTHGAHARLPVPLTTGAVPIPASPRAPGKSSVTFSFVSEGKPQGDALTMPPPPPEPDTEELLDRRRPRRRRRAPGAAGPAPRPAAADGRRPPGPPPGRPRRPLRRRPGGPGRGRPAACDDYLRDRPLPFYPWLRQFAWERLVEAAPPPRPGPAGGASTREEAGRSRCPTSRRCSWPTGWSPAAPAPAAA